MNKKLLNLFSQTLLPLLLLLLFAAGVNAQTITTFPWTETFEDASASRPNWSQINEVGTMNWTYVDEPYTGSDDPAYSGMLMANFDADSFDGEVTKLVSPVINLGAVSSPTLSFYYQNPDWGGDQNILKVYYRTSSAGAWTQLAVFDTDVSIWTSSGTISLPNPTATYQIALEGTSFYGYSIVVDQLVVNGLVDVGPVTGVDITTVGGASTQITGTSGALLLQAAVMPVGSSQGVTWSIVSGSEYATVDSSGMVMATANGTAVVRATSVANPAIFDEITITIMQVTGVDVSITGGAAPEITEVNGTLQLQAAVNPTGVNQQVTWFVVEGSSSASVSATGLVTGLSTGTVTVRAYSSQDPSLYDDIIINVLPVESIEISTVGGLAPEITMTGGTLQLMAVANPDGVGQEVTWSIESGADAASISETGMVTATGNGSVTVRATSVHDSAVYDEIIIMVMQVESLLINTIDEGAAEITVEGGTLQLTALVNPEGVSQEVAWSITSGSEYASISATGLVTATGNGMVTAKAISSVDPAIYDEIDITILYVETVEINTEGDVAAEINSMGGTLQLEAVLNPEGVDQAVSWQIISGSGTASVDTNGLVTAMADGTATIRAVSLQDNAKYDEIDVVITNQSLGLENFSKGSLRVYPNPATEVVYIDSFDAVINVDVYNMTGQKVAVKTSADFSQVDISALAAGNYIIKIATESSAKAIQLVKQ